VTRTLLLLLAVVTAPAQTMNMQEISRALGVECSYCHSAPRGSGLPQPKKDIARAMMAMTASLNASIQEATGKPSSQTVRVECVTCHHGVAVPQPVSAVILRTVAEKGGAAAADRYRELRKQYYGSGTYDFTEDALLETIQRIVEARPADAIVLLQMNLEFNPESAKTYALIGLACTRTRDDEGAIKNLEKSLQLDPANGIARGRLEQLLEYRRRRQAR